MILYFFSIGCFAQTPKYYGYEKADKKILEIPEEQATSVSEISGYISSNFETDQDKVRAAFIWVASNIEYDIDEMYSPNLYETRDEIIDRALTTRKGVCSAYSALFHDICIELGFRAYEIRGYTKQNGNLSQTGHGWNAVFVGDDWYIFDPTWGSGFLSRGKYVRSINDSYFMVEPSLIIESHMPFDYLWQFLYYPVTEKEFTQGQIEPQETKEYFNYPDSLALFDKQDTMERLIAAVSRIERNGVEIPMTFERLKWVKREIERHKEEETVSLYNSAADDNNVAVTFLNKYVDYWNTQFQPIKPDEEIQAMLDSITTKLHSAKYTLNRIQYTEGREAIIKELDSIIDENLSYVVKLQQWLDIYFSKKQWRRKYMFYRKI